VSAGWPAPHAAAGVQPGAAAAKTTKQRPRPDSRVVFSLPPWPAASTHPDYPLVAKVAGGVDLDQCRLGRPTVSVPCVEGGKSPGKHYWDGGIVSNSPLHFVWDERPLTSAFILQVDLFNAEGDLPRSLDEVLERLKNVQYASKQRFTADRIMEISDLRAALYSPLEKLPDKMKADPDVQKLATICDNRDWLVGRLINKRLPHVSQTKDYEFSRRRCWNIGPQALKNSANRLPTLTGVRRPTSARVSGSMNCLAKRPSRCHCPIATILEIAVDGNLSPIGRDHETEGQVCHHYRRRQRHRQGHR